MDIAEQVIYYLESKKDSLKLEKYNFDFKIFEEKLLNLCLFIFFLKFEYKDFERFCNIISLCNYIYFGKYPNKHPILNEETSNHFKLIYTKNMEKELGEYLYSTIDDNLSNFNEIQFISFVYYLSNILNFSNIKNYFKVKTNKKKLRERTLEVCFDKKKEINGIFNESTGENVYSFFNGRFESGINNIFPGKIPNDITEEELYNIIKKFKKEIKNNKVF